MAKKKWAKKKKKNQKKKRKTNLMGIAQKLRMRPKILLDMAKKSKNRALLFFGKGPND
jgi:hypothetical protein